ncbi:O-antigen ligase family protein [Stutzerimonas stutzeri]|uniref:O-antigen ligase family protein n=1 Tax=Stutzerimonas stutzeri TaxID=316 RepID=UPI000312E71C|nr:O-antigen ligase family protein [Stutzerimonas stutzeri]
MIRHKQKINFSITTTAAYMLLALSVILFCFSALHLWLAEYTWHDQQRIFQLVLLCITAPLAIFSSKTALPKQASAAVFLLLFIGILSTHASMWPEWALKEWSRFAGLSLLVIAIGGMQLNAIHLRSLLGIMAFIGLIQAFQFLNYYLLAFITGVYKLDTDILVTGFSNPRSFGQFQVLLMPVMAVLIAHSLHHRKKSLVSLLALGLSFHWCIAFTLGGRGLWLGLLASHLALLVINRKLWHIVALQAAAALLGFVLFLLLFKLVPLWLGLDPVLRDGVRTSLSGRELIWQWAWEMALANPWLGVGPMHYSATYNPIAAHPHQVFLQWLAEWGVVATVIALALCIWGLLNGARYLRSTSGNEMDAALWVSIVGALVLAQVDGVFVMPYTETWLALLIGLALGRQSTTLTAPSLIQRFGCAVTAIPVLLVLGKALISEAPTLPQIIDTYTTQYHTGLTPRFWSQGWIPM